MTDPEAAVRAGFRACKRCRPTGAAPDAAWRAEIERADAAFDAIARLTVAYVETPARGLDLPLDLRGTAFQPRVWQALREIPSGGTASYGEVARRIGKPKAARAVANACAGTAIALPIPCHRVIAGDGSPGGHRWGRARKEQLLAGEASDRSPPARGDTLPSE